MLSEQAFSHDQEQLRFKLPETSFSSEPSCLTELSKFQVGFLADGLELEEDTVFGGWLRDAPTMEQMLSSTPVLASDSTAASWTFVADGSSTLPAVDPEPRSSAVAVRSSLPPPAAVRSPLPLVTPKPDEVNAVPAVDVDTEGFHAEEDMIMQFSREGSSDPAEGGLDGAWTNRVLPPSLFMQTGWLEPEATWPETETLETEISSSGLEEVKKKSGRAVYRCSKCQAPKKGHKCPLDANNSDDKESVQSSVKKQKKRLNDESSLSMEPNAKKLKPSVFDARRMETKLKSFTMSCKWLLETGILQGQTVRYMANPGEVMGTGVVKDGLILCSCGECKGSQAFHASLFEKHLGSNARHPSEFLYLENGKRIKEVLEAAYKLKEKQGMLAALRAAVALHLCVKCRKSGNNLVHCTSEGCLNEYHPECVPVTPQSWDDWSCPECRRCKEVPSDFRRSTRAASSAERARKDAGDLSNGQQCPSELKRKVGRSEPSLSYSQVGHHAGRVPRCKARMLGSCWLQCGRDGEVRSCVSCSRAYHEGCTEWRKIGGDWLCSESCEGGTRKVKVALDSKQLHETTLCGCALCRIPDFEKSGFSPMTMLLCDQCEKEYHVGCLKKHRMANLQELPEGEWFCGVDCQSISSTLNLLLDTDETVPNTLAAKLKDANTCGSDLSWQLLHGKKSAAATKPLLAEAYAVLSNGFAPIVDPISGQNLLSLMVQSGSIRDQEFGGMYCMVLKRGRRVLSAAMLRIFGKGLAEMPVVATSTEHRGMGYFQVLFGCVERLLGLLSVEQVSLPAADGAEGIWLNKFGFSNMPKDELQRLREEVQLVFFGGSSVLRKPVPALSGLPARLLRTGKATVAGRFTSKRT